MHTLEQSVFDMYKECSIGSNPICQRCRTHEKKKFGRLSNPVSFWHIGEQFQADPNRCLFIGKNTVDGSDFPVIDGVHDTRLGGRVLYLYGHSPFWTYTDKIVRRAYDLSNRRETLSCIAITNLIKCNHSTGEECGDTTSDSMRQSCLEQLGVVWKEVDILKPRHIILYTGASDYDSHIERFHYGDAFQDENETNKSTQIPLGKNRLPWWERNFYSNKQLVLRMLRTGHPQGKSIEYIDHVAEWLKEGRTLFPEA